MSDDRINECLNRHYRITTELAGAVGENDGDLVARLDERPSADEVVARGYDPVALFALWDRVDASAVALRDAYADDLVARGKIELAAKVRGFNPHAACGIIFAHADVQILGR